MTSLRRFRFICLALLVAVLNAGAPVLAYAGMAGRGGPTQMICTAAGMQTVVIDADGLAHPVDAQPAQPDHCSLCSMPAALPTAETVPLAPSLPAFGVLRVGQSFRLLGSAVITPPATGPPARL